MNAERLPILGAPIRVLIPVRPGAVVERFVAAWRTAVEKTCDGSEVRCLDCEQLGEGLQSAGVGEQTATLLLVPEYAFRPSDLRAVLAAAATVDVVVPVRQGIARPAWLRVLGGIRKLVYRVVFGIETGPPLAWYGLPAWWRRSKLSWRFGLRVQDPGCGLLLVRREVLERCPIQSQGRFALVELIAKANFAGALIAEVPLGKPTDLPVGPPFADVPGDRRRVFRSPVFNQASPVA